MQQTRTRPPGAYLSNEPASAREIRYAWATVMLSALVFLATVSYAATPLAQFPVFIPIYVTALVMCDLITAVLLFGQYRALRSVALLVLAGAYFFTAAATSAYALIFPGLFAPTGLLGSGSQTSSALYMAWHAGFPLAIVAYARLKRTRPTIPVLAQVQRQKARMGIVTTIAIVVLLVVAVTVFATYGHALLPLFLDGNRTTGVGKLFLVGVWLLSAIALWQLWRSKPHTVLDVWLQVVMCVWLFDIALSAVLNTGRYDLGWYVGRIYGLLGAGFLLIVLLSENARQFARLVQVSAELRTANDTLWQISMHDGLTELANRRSFDRYLAEQLAVATRHARSLSLVLVDVDHFKDYNDQYGHQTGDECLKRIAAVLATCCQRPTDMAARYGGEEFALVLPDTDQDGAAHIAEAARTAVAALRIPHRKSSTGSHVSISSGVAQAVLGGAKTPEQMLLAADRALYQAKTQGRNRVVLAEMAPT